MSIRPIIDLRINPFAKLFHWGFPGVAQTLYQSKSVVEIWHNEIAYYDCYQVCWMKKTYLQIIRLHLSLQRQQHMLSN